MIKLTTNSEREFRKVLRHFERTANSRVLKGKFVAEALEPALSRSKDLVAVKTGRLKNSIHIAQTSDGADLAAGTPYAASEEYLGRPYLRPAVKQVQSQIQKKLHNKYQKEFLKA